MKVSIQIITFLILVTSCSQEYSSDQPEKEINRNEIDQTTQVGHPQNPIIQKDTSELQQGIKKLYHNGKLWKKENYEDGKLHGKNFEYWANGEVLMTEYQEGIRHGYFMHYAPGQSSATFITRWTNGKEMWSTFPIQIEEHFVPIKGYLYKEPDTIEIEVPYINGSILSTGTLVGKMSGGATPIGEHQVFYESGKLKALINYDTDTVIVFDKEGNIIDRSTTLELILRY